jgi:hypothetical protein
MKRVSLFRYQCDINATLGLLSIPGYRGLYTLENPWLDNKRNVSCIPTGRYICKPFSGEKYKNVYQVLNVENRSSILFHHGNWERNTQGCILVGYGVDYITRSSPMITNSKAAMDKMRSLLKEEDFELIIE